MRDKTLYEKCDFFYSAGLDRNLDPEHNTESREPHNDFCQDKTQYQVKPYIHTCVQSLDHMHVHKTLEKRVMES